MKAIEINEKQKEMLLEMCKMLFPEYAWDFHHHDEGKPDKSVPFNFLPGFIFGWEKYTDGEHSEYYHDVDIFIHWFEFCSKVLASQIYNFNIGKTKTTYSTFVAECIITSLIHPIEYLYQEFKELKL
jgi:hypothetical protein